MSDTSDDVMDREGTIATQRKHVSRYRTRDKTSKNESSVNNTGAVYENRAKPLRKRRKPRLEAQPNGGLDTLPKSWKNLSSDMQEQFRRAVDMAAARQDTLGPGQFLSFDLQVQFDASRIDAPKWADRSKDPKLSAYTGLNPVEWITTFYGRRQDGVWDPCGLARADLQEVDPDLYAAYGSWVRKGRHPEDKLVFADKPPRDALSKDVATDRRREAARQAAQHRRDEKAKGLSLS